MKAKVKWKLEERRARRGSAAERAHRSGKLPELSGRPAGEDDITE